MINQQTSLDIVCKFFQKNSNHNKNTSHEDMKYKSTLTGKYHKGLKDMETGLFKCPYCDYYRDKQSTVSEHITRLHPVEAGRNVEQFKCSYCGDCFQAKSQLNVHISNHHEIKYLECPHQNCDYKGKQKTTVYNHYGRIHMNQGDIIEQTKDTGLWCCKTCSKEYKFVSVFYHVATCSPKSPFYEAKN